MKRARLRSALKHTVEHAAIDRNHRSTSSSLIGLGDPLEAQDIGRPVPVPNDRAHGRVRRGIGKGHGL